jgi:ribosomal-protein-alanine N-acetyltransferase
MERMPFHTDLERADYAKASTFAKATADGSSPRATTMIRAIESTTSTTVTTSDWQDGLPVLAGSTFSLRELRVEDAPSLLALLTTEEVARFISPPPTTVEGFEQFILWAQKERQAGTYACFAVVPNGMTTAVGIFQLRSLAAGFDTAEWGFVMGSQFWGSGIFAEGARLVVDFAVDVIGTHRLEARAAVANGRGNGALRKIGAVQEGVLRRSFVRNGVTHDQVLWGIVADDWRLQRLSQLPTVIH